jgi:Family of unknown function (DUF6090)
MFKFFRTIRLDLMENKNSGKYFKYAIGEIILVVIGILVAMSINNWNQQRLQNGKEQGALLNLKEDFEANSESFETIISSLEKSIKADLQVLNHTGNKPKPKTQEEFDKLLNFITQQNEFYPQNGFLDDLLNSGKLGIIRNQALRVKLSSWYPMTNKIKVRDLEVDRKIDLMTNYIFKHGSWLDADAVSTTETVKKYDFPASGFEIDNRDLLNNLEFENRVEDIIYMNDLLMDMHSQGLQLANEILVLIDQEIDK